MVELTCAMDVYQWWKEFEQWMITSSGTNLYNGHLPMVEQIRTMDVYQWWKKFVQWTFTNGGTNSYFDYFRIVRNRFP